MFYYSKTSSNNYGLAIQKSSVTEGEASLYIASELQIVYPIVIDETSVREMTRYEKYTRNLTKLGLHEYADVDTQTIVYDELYTNPNYVPEETTTGDSVPNEVLTSLQTTVNNLLTRTTSVEEDVTIVEGKVVTLETKASDLEVIDATLSTRLDTVETINVEQNTRLTEVEVLAQLGL